MTRSAVGDAVAFHAAFAVVAALSLVVADGGWTVLALVVLYNVALPAVGVVRGHRDWVRRWAFLVPLSAFQVVPDAFLASVLGSLDFPDSGGPRVGPVPLAMAGMWTIPLWTTLSVADARWGGSWAKGAAWAAAIGALVLVGSEATLTVPMPLAALPIWQAVGVTSVGPVALYVVAPELVIGGVAWLAYRLTRARPYALQVLAAAGVTLVYLGALAASYGWIEVALR